MFSFTAAAKEISRRADAVADFDRGPYVPGPIGPSVILNAYNGDLCPLERCKIDAFISSVAFKLLL